MAGNIQLNDLIEALAGAVIEAQDNIEQHQLSNLLAYFDKDKRPRSLVVRLPSVQPGVEEGTEDLYRAPLLSLISTNMLKIKDVEIAFDVELGHLTSRGAQQPQAAMGLLDEDAPVKNISVDMDAGKRSSGGNVHVVLRVESAEPTDGAARLVNQLAQTQGVFRTFKAE